MLTKWPRVHSMYKTVRKIRQRTGRITASLPPFTSGCDFSN